MSTMWRCSSTVRTYVSRSLTSPATFRRPSPEFLCGPTYSPLMSPPSFSHFAALSSPPCGFFRHSLSLYFDNNKRLKVKGYALLSTSSGDVNGAKQVIKPNISREAKIDQVPDTKILTTLAKYLWSRDNFEFRIRVVAALGFLVGAKVLNVQVPFLFKLAVDWLTTATGNANALASFTASNSYMLGLFVSPAAVLLGYGIARTGAAAFNELRTAVFSNVALRTIRSISRKVFSHLHELDLRYHLSRETGALNRIIDRGSRAINFILSSMVFNVVPTILEVY